MVLKTLRRQYKRAGWGHGDSFMLEWPCLSQFKSERGRGPSHPGWVHWGCLVRHIYLWLGVPSVPAATTAVQGQWEITAKRCPINWEKNWSDLIKHNISVWCQIDLLYSFKEAPGTVHQALFSLLVFAVAESIKTGHRELTVGEHKWRQYSRFCNYSNVFMRSPASFLSRFLPQP